MDPNEYELMYQVELTHGWYCGMRLIVEKVLRYYLPQANGRAALILDAGCGTGAGMQQLSAYGKVFGIDISALAISFCTQRNLPDLARASVESTPFRPETFDLITSFDVLYEDSVADDLLVVSEFNRITRPGGYLFLRLPAYRWLMGSHDRVVHTRRRYTRTEVIQMLTRAGYEIEYTTYANMLLFPLVAIKRLMDRIWPPRQARSDLRIQAPGFNQIQRTMLLLESSLIPWVSLPYGSSIFAVGRKSGYAHV